MLRDVSGKEIQGLGIYTTKFYRSNVTALHFHGHFSK